MLARRVQTAAACLLSSCLGGEGIDWDATVPVNPPPATEIPCGSECACGQVCDGKRLTPGLCASCQSRCEACLRGE